MAKHKPTHPSHPPPGSTVPRPSCTCCSSLHPMLWAIAFLSCTASLFIASRFAFFHTLPAPYCTSAACLLRAQNLVGSSHDRNGSTHALLLQQIPVQQPSTPSPGHLPGSNLPDDDAISMGFTDDSTMVSNSLSGSSSPVFAGDLRSMEKAWNNLCFGTPPSQDRLRLAVFVKKWPVGGVPGGLERHALTLHRDLARRGHVVHVYTMSPGPQQPPHNGTSNETQLIDGNLAVHFFPPTPSNTFDHGKALRAFMEHNASEPFHVVHSESVALPHWRAPEIAAPLVATWHGIAYETVHTDIVMDLVRKPGDGRSVERVKTMNSKLLRVADEVRFFSKYEHHVATSDYVGDVLQTIYELPLARVHTVLNGVNASEFYPDPAKGAALRAKHGVPENASLVLGVAGRLVLDKGHGLLMDAFKELIIESSEYPDVYLLVAGQGPWEDKYKALAPRVRVLGSLPPAQLAEFYNALDIFANPTMRAQGLDHTLLEAMQCGKPVLATRFSSITRSVIIRPEFGYTFSPNVAALSEALRLVLTDGRKVLQHKGEACRSYAARMFSAKKMASAYERLFLCLHNSSYCQYPLTFDQLSCNVASNLAMSQ